MTDQESTDGKDVCKYELLFKPHLIQLNSNAKLANILERMEKLEKFVGANKFDMVIFTFLLHFLTLPLNVHILRIAYYYILARNHCVKQ